MFYPEARPNPTAMHLLGLPVHPADVTEIHAFIAQVILKGEKALAINLNIHAAVLASGNPDMYELIRSAHIVFCDGDGIRWGLRILGHKPPPKIPTTRWIWQLAEFSDARKYKLFFLGTTPEIMAEAVRRIKAKHPRLEIASHHGFFKKEGTENGLIIEKINAFSPDILLVGFGMPIQEKWLYRNWKNIKAHIFLKGGGVFDYVAGELGEVPAWMIRRHLEWLFRIYEEPGRLLGRYLYDIPVFFCGVICEKIQKLFGANTQKNNGDRL